MIQQLQAYLQPLGRVAVAYSGGVDSTIVLKAALNALGAENVIALLAVSPSLPQSEKDEAIALENKSRIVRTGEQISQQITELYPQFEENQNNVDVARRIATLYEQWFEAAVASGSPDEEVEGYLDNAIWFYTHTNSNLTGADPNIARKCSDLQFKKMERRIKVLEDWLAQVDPNDPDQITPPANRWFRARAP